MTNILGVYAGHNASAALVIDGSVVAAASEERFNGHKNFIGYPREAIAYCLNISKIHISNLDIVSIPFLTGSPLKQDASDFSSSLFSTIANIHKLQFALRQRISYVTYSSKFFRHASDYLYSIAWMSAGRYAGSSFRQEVARNLGISPSRVKSYDHHLSHAASYFSSPFNHERALVLILDGEGDNCCATVYTAVGLDLKQIARSPRGTSIGQFFAAITIFLGMRHNELEYKVMGLAPYAKDEDVERVLAKMRGIIYPDPANPLIFRSRFNT